MVQEFIHPNTLLNICYYSATEDVRHDFTDEEMIDLKNDLYNLTQEKFVKSNILAGIKQIIAESTDVITRIHVLIEKEKNIIDTQPYKIIEKEINSILMKIKNGYEIVNRKIYGVDDQDEGLMAIYSEDGTLLNTRKLFSTERQTTILKQLNNQ